MTGILRRWYDDLVGKVTAGDGWLLIAKVIVFSVGLLGVGLALFNYRSSVITEYRANTDANFLQFKNLLFSSDRYEHLVALSNFGNFFSLEAPKLLHYQGLLNRSLLPAQTEQPYLADSRETILLYFAKAFSSNIAPNSITVSTLFPSQQVFIKSSLSSATSTPSVLNNHVQDFQAREIEFNKIILLLGQLGCHGWNDGLPNPSVERRADLQWLWLTSSNRDTILAELTAKPNKNCNKSLSINPSDATQSNSNTIIENLSSCTKQRPADQQYNKISDNKISELFSAKDLSDLSFRGFYLMYSNFSKTQLWRTDFSNSILTSANLSGADLTNTAFERSRLVNANLSGSRGTGTKFTESELCGTIFDDASIEKLVLRGPAIIGTQPRGSSPPSIEPNQRLQAKNSSFRQVKLPNAEFSNVDLSEASLFRARLSESSFHQVIASKAIFSEANLSSAKFFCVDFSDTNSHLVNFQKATFELASFRNSNLRGASFAEATIEQTSFDNADLDEVDFTNAKIDTQTVSFKGAMNLNRTRGLTNDVLSSLTQKTPYDSSNIRDRCRFK